MFAVVWKSAITRKKTSFFIRGQEVLAKNANAILRLTSFGLIGDQLNNKIKLTKALRKDPKVIKGNITSLVSSFVTETVNEDKLYDVICSKLKSEFPAFNGEWEIKYLLQWISELAERQLTLSLDRLYNQLLSFREVEARQATSQVQLGIRVKRFSKTIYQRYQILYLKKNFLRAYLPVQHIFKEGWTFGAMSGLKR